MAAKTFQTTSNLQVVDFKADHQWNISVAHDKPGVFSFAGTETANVNADVTIFWSHPQQPLTLVIETPFTKTRTPFDVHFVGRSFGGLSAIYQIVDGEEIEIDDRAKPLIVSSDSNYQVVIKLVCDGCHYFGSHIEYHAKARKCH